MTADHVRWDRLAALIDYPCDDAFISSVAATAAALADAGETAAADAMTRFSRAIEQQPLARLQEEYASAFDFDAGAALELGWHLFGDGPERGPWLATLAEELARAGVPAGNELPDHLSRVLMLLAREDPTRSAGLADLVAPAIHRIHQRLRETGSVYAAVVEAACCAADGYRAQVRVGRD